MGWFVEGNEASIGFDSITPGIWGSGKQHFMTSIHETGTPPDISNAKAHWVIHPNSAPELSLDGAGDGTFYKKVQEKPGICHFHIGYQGGFENYETAVRFSLAAPTDLFEKYFSIWQDILCNGSQVRYVMHFDFIGFRVPEAETEIPTIAEWQAETFLDRKNAYGNEVSISFHALPKIDGTT